MDNFDLTKFLTEGKLYEAMSPQDVVDIADTVAEEFTIESEIDGDFLIYTVGNIEGEGFELDTDISAQTPKDLDTRGVGEGWGGIFRIKPTADGYEVRNAEKGGLVAMIDSSGNFRMLSAAESRDELDMDRYNDDLDMKDDKLNPGMYIDDEEWEREMGRMEESKEETKSNKMKKSELKEMIRAAMLAETSVEETLVDADQDMAEAILNALGGEAAFEAVVRAMSTDDAQTYLGAIMRDHDIEMEPAGDIPGFEGTMDALDSLSIREEDVDMAAVQSDENEAMDQVDEAEEEEVADEIEVDAEETEDVETVDAEVEDTETVDVETTAEISPEVKAAQDALTAAIEAAKALGDQKLADQIGNSITFFTRTHVVGQDKVAEGVEMPANVVNKANIAVKDAPTMAATMLDLYKQIQDKEQVDMSKNQTFKMVLNYLEKLASQAKAGGSEEKEEVSEDLSLTRMLKNAGIKK